MVWLQADGDCLQVNFSIPPALLSELKEFFKKLLSRQMEEKRLTWTGSHFASSHSNFFSLLARKSLPVTKRNLISYRPNAVSPNFCKCYLSNWMTKYLTSPYNLAGQSACLTYCVGITCFRASQRRVLSRVLLVTSGAFISLRFRIWHAFRMQLPALVTGRNITPEACAASQRDLVRLEEWADRNSWSLTMENAKFCMQRGTTSETNIRQRQDAISLLYSKDTLLDHAELVHHDPWVLHCSCPWPVLDPGLIPR